MLSIRLGIKGLISVTLYALLRAFVINFPLLRCDALLRVYILHLYYALLRIILKSSQAIGFDRTRAPKAPKP